METIRKVETVSKHLFILFIHIDYNFLFDVHGIDGHEYFFAQRHVQSLEFALHDPDSSGVGH